MGTLAAASVALVAITVALNRPGGQHGVSGPLLPVGGVDEGRVVGLVSEIQRLHMDDTDAVTIQTADYRPNARLILLGGGEQAELR